jgi:hypothetical protein
VVLAAGAPGGEPSAGPRDPPPVTF